MTLDFRTLQRDDELPPIPVTVSAADVRAYLDATGEPLEHWIGARALGDDTPGSGTSGDGTSGDSTFGEKTSGESTSGENTSGENRSGENSVTVPPLALGALCLAGLMERLPLPRGALHIGQDFDFVRPIPAGQPVQALIRVVRRSERGGAVILALEIEASADGRPVLRGRTTVLFPPEDDRDDRDADAAEKPAS